MSTHAPLLPDRFEGVETPALRRFLAEARERFGCVTVFGRADLRKTVRVLSDGVNLGYVNPSVLSREAVFGVHFPDNGGDHCFNSQVPSVEADLLSRLGGRASRDDFEFHDTSHSRAMNACYLVVRSVELALDWIANRVPREADLGATLLPDWRPDEVTEDEVHVEGALRRVTVNAYERNPDARRRCIERHKPICQACTFDFEATYGDIGLVSSDTLQAPFRRSGAGLTDSGRIRDSRGVSHGGAMPYGQRRVAVFSNNNGQPKRSNMALVLCPECSWSVSTAAAACPNCGYPVGRPKREEAAPPDRNQGAKTNNRPYVAVHKTGTNDVGKVLFRLVAGFAACVVVVIAGVLMYANSSEYVRACDAAGEVIREFNKVRHRPMVASDLDPGSVVRIRMACDEHSSRDARGYTDCIARETARTIAGRTFVDHGSRIKPVYPLFCDVSFKAKERVPIRYW